jgi:U4/U6.U5 tri-snRNP-associated protein 2
MTAASALQKRAPSPRKDDGNGNKRKKNEIECPYLDTIDRHRLDFDFEKLCSVSLSNLNVYACLVCGKYFQGECGAG